MLSITPVILSGGSGTRLWPNSRAQHPKQFLRLTSDLSLIQQTANSLKDIANVSPPIILANHKLSLQLHHHRAEHWLVVKGVADVTNGDNHIVLNVNESTYIPIGMKHSLANSTKEDLEIIEVQSGSYLGEDDIVRFDDVYGRHKD